MIAPFRLNARADRQAGRDRHQLSGGRLTLGVAVGGREDDYEASGADFHRRGKEFDRCSIAGPGSGRGDDDRAASRRAAGRG